MQQTWWRAAETMHASPDVISTRTGNMHYVTASPMQSAGMTEAYRMGMMAIGYAHDGGMGRVCGA